VVRGMTVRERVEGGGQTAPVHGGAPGPYGGANLPGDGEKPHRCPDGGVVLFVGHDTVLREACGAYP
jgi:hypothetical protein